MQVDLNIRNADLAKVLRSYADRRLRFALSRFGGRVGRVVVTVSEHNGAGLSAATSCHISAELKPFGQVAVQDTDLDLYTAIDRAAGRMGRLVALRLEQSGNDVQRLVSSTDRARGINTEGLVTTARSRRPQRERLPKRRIKPRNLGIQPKRSRSRVL